MKVWVRPALVTALLAASGVPGVDAQRYCYEIWPGETAARLAQRLTGDARNRHAPWFEIVDHRWRVVPKTHYGVIHPGWLACVDHAQSSPARTVAPPRAVDRVADSRPQPVAILGSSIDFTIVVVGALILAALSAWRFIVTSYRRRRRRTRAMRSFGAEFVREFGRPLAQFRGAAPLPRARLRVNPRRSQLEILLAPPQGRSYPNLSDHRSNVDYDVARVVRTLARDSFATGRPYAEGEWVVLPFEYKDPVKREGVR